MSKIVSHKKAIELLKAGGVVAVPTETVYGLAAIATAPKSVEKIFAAKKRPTNNPLIVHVPSLDALEEFAHVTELARELGKLFWPGPLTLVLKKKNRIPNLVTAGLSTVAIRIPNQPLTLEILRGVGAPLAAPSANLFTQLSPTTAKQVLESLGDSIDGVVDGGECRIGIESTILSLEDAPTILRVGGLSIERLEEVIGVRIAENRRPRKVIAPGQHPFHYAPKTPVYDPIRADTKPSSNAAIITLSRKDSAFRKTVALSHSGSLEEAASRLYSTLHELDSLKLDFITYETFPNVGLGKAINDRLKRASQ